MNKIIAAGVVAVLGLTSIASADRGYSRARSEASFRYERGGDRHDRGSYGRSDYRSDYRGDYGRYDRGHSDRGSRSRGSFGLSFGYSSYNDSGYFGLSYNSGPRYSRSYDCGPRYYASTYYAPTYYAPAPVYVAPAPVYISPPVYYESRSYYAPSYYSRSYGGGYYCR